MTPTGKITGAWGNPIRVAPSNFIHKSLSNWSCNVAVGCRHGCRFCYVPQVSTNRLAPALNKLGVADTDADWGDYVFVKPFDEQVFMAYLKRAERTPVNTLPRDGNRAVMFCTTTDPYQVASAGGVSVFDVVEKCLVAIRDHSTLNVRILTRGTLAVAHFDLMRSFGGRLMFGVSLPTMNERLLQVYEPGAPSGAARLETLKLAKRAGLNVYVAAAPVFPECDAGDIGGTLMALRDINPMTVFMEPINIRAGNIERIKRRAAMLGCKLNSDVFNTVESWRSYAVNQMTVFEHGAAFHGLTGLHLWPDASLATKSAVNQLSGEFGAGYLGWLNQRWARVSEWPLTGPALMV